MSSSSSSSPPPPLPTLTATPTHYPDCCLSLSTNLLNFLSSLFVRLESTTRSPTIHTATISAAAAAAPAITVFSIGSGQGLLEALLTRHLDEQQPDGYDSGQAAAAAAAAAAAVVVIGVEVYALPPVNKYLAEECVWLVRGTWDVSEAAVTANTTTAATAATAWMFVYPRRVSLVGKYVDMLSAGHGQERGLGQAVQMVIWAGPRADLEDYEGVFGRLQAWGWLREEYVEGEQKVGIAEWESIVVLIRGVI